MRKQMRMSPSLLGLLVTAVMLVGCAKKDEGTPISSRNNGPRALMTGNQSLTTGSLQGKIYANPMYQTEFQETMVEFLSASTDPRYIGMISAVPQANSGVRFSGRVSLSNGNIRNIGMTGGFADISMSSSIAIQVQDFAPQFPNMAALPAVIVNRARGQFVNNEAQIEFADNFGAITLQGAIVGNVFRGVISFVNYVRFDGSAANPDTYTMGDFEIPVCSFFVCN